VSLLLTRPYYTHAPAGQRGKRTLQALLRYALVTGAWFLVTQWFFGPAVIDRTFVLTGGKCERLSSPSSMLLESGSAGEAWEGVKAILTAAACKAAGGSWMGGHDVSGHVFMLVLGSSFLAFEALGTSHRVVTAGSEGDEGSNNKKDGDGDERGVLSVYASRFVWVVVGLSWWMLFMTAIWFHTWVEKVYSSLCEDGKGEANGLAIWSAHLACRRLYYLYPPSQSTGVGGRGRDPWV
jgi:Inositol phospholipid synthesis and fat-storage-inducing TM